MCVFHLYIDGGILYSNFFINIGSQKFIFNINMRVNLF